MYCSGLTFTSLICSSSVLNICSQVRLVCHLMIRSAARRVRGVRQPAVLHHPRGQQNHRRRRRLPHRCHLLPILPLLVPRILNIKLALSFPPSPPSPPPSPPFPLPSPYPTFLQVPRHEQEVPQGWRTRRVHVHDLPSALVTSLNKLCLLDII